MNKPDALDHYETQARAALYPELVRALNQVETVCRDNLYSQTSDCRMALDFVQSVVRLALSRLPLSVTRNPHEQE